MKDASAHDRRRVVELATPLGPWDVRARIEARAVRPSMAMLFGFDPASRLTNLRIREWSRSRRNRGVRAWFRSDGDIDLEQFAQIMERGLVDRCRMTTRPPTPQDNVLQGYVQTVLHCRFRVPFLRVVVALVIGVIWSAIGLFLAIGIWTDITASGGAEVVFTNFGGLTYVLNWLEEVEGARPINTDR